MWRRSSDGGRGRYNIGRGGGYIYGRKAGPGHVHGHDVDEIRRVGIKSRDGDASGI